MKIFHYYDILITMSSVGIEALGKLWYIIFNSFISNIIFLNFLKQYVILVFSITN